MDSTTIEREHAARIARTLRPTLAYLYRLQRRMTAVGFPLNDPLSQRVSKAIDAVQELSMEFHYRSCKGGVGRS